MLQQFSSIPCQLSSLIDNDLKPLNYMTSHHKKYLNELRDLKANKVVPNKTNFLLYLKIALYAEELKHRRDLEQYNLYRQNIIRVTIDDKISSFFKIHVKGLEEERPSIKIDDLVELIDVFSEKKESYKFKVNFVSAEYITINANHRFCHEFETNKEYDIKFCLNDYPFRCGHKALSNIESFKLTPLLFPNKKPLRPIDCRGNLPWFNTNIANNVQQREAVFHIILKSSLDSPYILYGPPGTGKTSTVVEAICQAWRRKDTRKILVCTPSNTSADVITKILINYDIDKKDLLRIYSLSIDVNTIHKDILDCCNIHHGKIQTKFCAKNLPKIIVTTLCTSSRLYYVHGLEPTTFSYVFIDEAGQATEPDSMIPFGLLSNNYEYVGKLCGQIVLAGDPKQLGPVVLSKISKPLLGRSMIERMMTTLRPYQLDENGRYNSRYITKLIHNYRCHPAIIHVPNKLFYEGQLIPCDSANVRRGENWEGLPNRKFPIIFQEVMGQELKDNGSPSVYNNDELKMVLSYVRRLLRSKLGDMIVKGKDIGIVTPFTAQKLKLQRMLKDKKISDVEVGTVQLFQGKEKEVIILTTVRTKIFKDSNGETHIGFLSDPRRFNVALTRAKSLLIVIGHPNALSIDEKWHTLLQYCCDNQSYLMSDSNRTKNLKKNFGYRARKSVKKLQTCVREDAIIRESDDSDQSDNPLVNDVREPEQSDNPLLNDASCLVLQTENSSQLNVYPRINTREERIITPNAFYQDPYLFVPNLLVAALSFLRRIAINDATSYNQNTRHNTINDERNNTVNEQIDLGNPSNSNNDKSERTELLNRETYNCAIL